MKFDFNNSTYVRLWEDLENSNLLQQFLDTDMISIDYGWWNSQFSVDPNLTPRQADGTATFSSKMRKIAAAGVLNMRAPLGDTMPRDKQGVAFYTATIPDFAADAYVETAMEREYREQMFQEYFGDDAQLLLAFADNVQTMINDADQTINNMSAQLLSKGNIVYNIGRGIKGALYEANIPEANFKKAGAVVWSDPECMLLDQMRQIEEELKQEWGTYMPMKWQIPYDMFHNVFLKNKQVLEWIRYYKSLGNVLLPESFTATEELFRSAVASFEGISPIEIVQEKQKDYSGMVQGWEQNIAVLRPQGYAGPVKRSSILDQYYYEKYGSSVINRTFGRVGTSGLYTVMNTTLNNGNMKEWHTDLFAACVPALDEFLFHVIVNTAEADE